MSLSIIVNAYSGCKANERPREFILNGHSYEIVEVEDRWYEPDAAYFRVRTADQKRYILRYDEGDDEWTLQSGFDGDELLSQPGITVITVRADVIRQAEALIESCEHCNPGAEIPFDWILDRVTGNLGSKTDYILETPAKCPNYKREILEKTLVGPSETEGERG